MQTNATIRYHLTPVGMVIIKEKTTSAGQDMEKQEHVHTVGGTAQYYCCYEKEYGSSSNN